MPWMVMHDGQEVSLSFPRPGDLTPARMAHNLSMINRFVGSAYRPYSVLEHSLLVADIMERHMALSVHAVFAGLWHDGHEAITNDQSTPSKDEIGPGWDIFEGKFADLVATNLTMRTARLRYAREIATADRLALAIERAQLMPQQQPDGQPSTPWPCLARVPVLEGYDLRAPWREQRSWKDWRDEMLQRHVQLDNARQGTPMVNVHILEGSAN